MIWIFGSDQTQKNKTCSEGQRDQTCMASRSTCGSSSVRGTRVQRDGCRGGVNQRGDPLPAAPSLSLCACEGSGVAAGLWSRPEHNPPPRGQAWSDWSTDWLLSLFSHTLLPHFSFSLDFAPCHTVPICSHLYSSHFVSCSALLLFTLYKKRLWQPCHKSSCCHDWHFGGLSGTSCVHIMPVNFVNFKIFLMPVWKQYHFPHWKGQSDCWSIIRSDWFTFSPEQPGTKTAEMHLRR